jgi:hypothetical protein
MNREVLERGEVEDPEEGVHVSRGESDDVKIAKGWYRKGVVRR